MGTINILNDAGTAKLSLQFTGTTNKSLNSELLSSITSDVQAQLDSKVPRGAAFFAVKQDGTINASTGVASAITFNSTYHDRTNSWNGSRFTAPAAGTYHIIFEHMYHHDGGDITFQIFKNGTVVSYNNPYGKDLQGYAEQWNTNSVHWLGAMAVGDYIEFKWASTNIATTTLYGAGLYTKVLGFYLG